MRRFWEDMGVPLLLMVGGLAVAFAGLYFIFAAMNKVECANLNEVTKRRTDFRWLGGCYVEHEGEMLPYERWKLLEIRVKDRR